MISERNGAAEPGRPRLVLATANEHKLAELARILAASAGPGGRPPQTLPLAGPGGRPPQITPLSQAGVDLVGLGEFPGAPLVAETGATFAENALLKARAVARFSGLPVVADDSGLCVDALNGMPGVLSARWAGRHGDDEGNLRLVLAQLADVPDDRRGAHFFCAAALVLPSGREHVSEGTVYGRLTREPRGAGGFGYDPIFVPDPSELVAGGGPAAPAGLTTAEMSPEAKDAVSHRGRALRALAPVIAAALG